MTPAHRWSAAKLVPKDSVRCAAAWDYRSAPSSPSRVSHPLFGELRGRITLEASYGIEPSPPAASIAARPRTAPPRLQASAALMLSPTEYQQRRRPVSAATADKVLATRREVQRARVSPSRLAPTNVRMAAKERASAVEEALDEDAEPTPLSLAAKKREYAFSHARGVWMNHSAFAPSLSICRRDAWLGTRAYDPLFTAQVH